ncbi:hypothetical protein AcV5_000375 [Taiwanofungus camphoratus]|nr:hypothetical protein AcV5_000375 [Antrodia cinnamomea]
MVYSIQRSSVGRSSSVSGALCKDRMLHPLTPAPGTGSQRRDDVANGCVETRSYSHNISPVSHRGIQGQWGHGQTQQAQILGEAQGMSVLYSGQRPLQSYGQSPAWSFPGGPIGRTTPTSLHGPPSSLNYWNNTATMKSYMSSPEHISSQVADYGDQQSSYTGMLHPPYGLPMNHDMNVDFLSGPMLPSGLFGQFSLAAPQELLMPQFMDNDYTVPVHFQQLPYTLPNASAANFSANSAFVSNSLVHPSSVSQPPSYSGAAMITTNPLSVTETPRSPQNLVDNPRCCWDGSCVDALTDLTPRGISRHLEQSHLVQTTHRHDKRRRVICLWNGCFKNIKLENIGKHIAAVHLKSTRQTCSVCKRVFSRKDALRRHQKDCCPRVICL